MRLTQFSDITDRILLFVLTIFVIAGSVSGTAGSIVGGAAAIVFVASVVVTRRVLHFRELRFFYWPTILFVLWMVLSAVVNGFDQEAARAMRHEWILLLIPACVLIMSDERRSRRLVTAFSVGVGLISLYAIGQFFFGWNFLKPHYLLERNGIGYWIIGNFSSTVTFGIYFAVAGMFLIGYGLAGTNRNRSATQFSLACGAIAIAASLLSGERGPLVAIVVSMIGLAIFLRSRRVVMALVGFGAVIIALGVVSGVFSRISNLWDKELSLLHDQGRRFIWTQSLLVAADHPAFGIGPGNFKEGYAAVMPTEPPGFLPQGHAHNDYLMYAAQSGFPELIFFLGMWVAVLWYALRVCRSKSCSDQDRRLALGALLGSVCFATTSLFDIPFGHSTTRQMLMFIWAAALAAYLNLRRSSTA